MKWQVQQAKARFSEMVERAIKDGPQTITRHGKPVAVLVRAEDFDRPSKGRRSFKEILMSGPDIDLKIVRSREKARKVDL
ncbi:MAG TPA: type II toxin-antitoxin system Phd/YefM family antitoxin [Candidatus Binataceae bacterium]|nr:type II toxin-antitoxin system Phd/YefM family antitoxin [Candidatus Binataceae bacterium]